MMPHGNAPVKTPTLCTFCLLSRLFRAGVYKSVFIEMNYIPILCAKGWLAIAKLKPLSLFISLNIIA